MPKFKEKNTRKIHVENNSITTLDGKHQEMIDELRHEKEENIPKLRKEQKTLRQKLLSNKMSIEEELETKDRISEIKKQIQTLKQKEKDYLLNNSELVFGYFENKMEVAEGNNKTTILDNFFKSDTPNKKKVEK